MRNSVFLLICLSASLHSALGGSKIIFPAKDGDDGNVDTVFGLGGDGEQVPMEGRGNEGSPEEEVFSAQDEEEVEEPVNLGAGEEGKTFFLHLNQKIGSVQYSYTCT